MTGVAGKKQQPPTAEAVVPRRLPIGAEAVPGNGAHFRVWAPFRKKIEVLIEGGVFNRNHSACAAVELKPEPEGYFSGTVAAAMDGTLYRYRLDGGDACPDPASRFQPIGPHGPSRIVDPGRFVWTDNAWPGISIRGQVIYEMHIGTFSREGTWRAASALLPELAQLGITVLEILPVADFPGRFGWGYDGVDFFAPTRLYGAPDDFREFVNTAHSLRIGVILDVVYNHQGPDGCYLSRFSPDYFTDRYETEWGSAFNFDGKNSGPVREFILSNAGYWIEEFHLDGLRLDATQSLFDGSPEHILAAITRRVRNSARGRSTILIAENEPQNAKIARPFEEGGFGMDALWNDDFHHAARVAMTGINEAYYMDYLGTPQEFISAIKWGYLYQGQYYKWQRKKRGTSSLGLNPETFVIFIQNHDQIANTARGRRIHLLAGPGIYRAMTALLLLSPGTPMLFQGQEFAASSPFLYFADHKPEIAEQVRKGRMEFLSQFPSMATAELQARLADPTAADTFERSKLDFSERERHAEQYALHCDLLRLRRNDPVLKAQGAFGIEGAVLSGEAFVLRYFGEGGDDRLIIVNFGRDLRLDPAPVPLLAPPSGDKVWEMLWSSEDPRYGGRGTPQADTELNWNIDSTAVAVFMPIGRRKRRHG